MYNHIKVQNKNFSISYNCKCAMAGTKTEPINLHWGKLKINVINFIIYTCIYVFVSRQKNLGAGEGGGGLALHRIQGYWKGILHVTYKTIHKDYLGYCKNDEVLHIMVDPVRNN